MFKFVAVLALVAAASARPQTIEYELPGGSASLTLGAGGAKAAPAPAKAVKVAAAPVARAIQAPVQYVRFAQAPAVQYISAAPAQVQYVQAAPQPAQLVAVAPAPAPKKAPEPEPFDANPQYSFAYNVNDAESGDAKSASESRDGDKVTGSYSVVEPDGAVRTVTYTADAENGFNAKVERTPGAAPAPVVVAKPAPVARIAVAPAPVKIAAAPAQQYVLVQQQPQAFQSSNLIRLVPSGFSSTGISGISGINGQQYVIVQ